MNDKMSVAQMIKELRKMGVRVEGRRRSDGGWLITKINGVSFSGAKGNQYAREILGLELSPARIEQTHYNVQKFIKGSKKPKDKLEEELNRKLKSVQAQWRRRKVGAKLTKKKLRWHISKEGTEAAKRYLERMERYGKGLAYEENVIWVAEYIRDSSKSIEDKDIAEAYRKMADRLESKKETIREEQLKRILEIMYDVREHGYDNNAAAQGLIKLVGIIGG